MDEPDCPFCDSLRSGKSLAENDLAAVLPDAYPVSQGHVLIVPKRHEGSADQADWVLSGQRLLGATRAMYLHFPSSGLLWVSGKEFQGPNTALLQELLAA